MRTTFLLLLLNAVPSLHAEDLAPWKSNGHPSDVRRQHVQEIEREQRSLDPEELQWGIEKPPETRVEPIGTATQRFVIDIEP